MRARTAGSFAVFSSDERKITPRSRKARALLAYLISDPGSEVPKTRILDLLWGDRGEAQARASLRQALLELRICINTSQEIVCWDREHVWLRAGILIEEPPDESSGHKEAFQDLDGVSIEFDDWLTHERSRRATRRVAALKKEAEELLRVGRAADSLTAITKMQAISPYDEDALRLVMKSEFQLRRPAALAERYRATAALMFADLGVEPSQETRGLRDQLIARLIAKHEDASVSETEH